MKASAWSIRNLLVVILVLCADFYLIRDSFDLNFRYPYFGWPEAFQYGFLGSLPMTNLVVIGGSVILSKGGKRRAFLAGFVLAGAVGIAVCLALSLAIPSEWSGFLDPSNPRVTIWMRRHALLDSFDSQSAIVLRLAIATALFTIPEVLIALAGGYAACSLAWARDWDPRATTWRLPGGTIGLGRSEAGTEEAAMSQKTIHERDDVKPERGEHDYGDVEFADPVNKKYPIDTAEHVRAAWNYIHHADNAAKYPKDEVETIKSRIKRAAKQQGVEIQAD